MEFKLNKIEDWQKVVDEILPQLQHNIFLLKGNLGAGKTTFTQFLLKKLGSNDEVSSPTYAIVNEYHSPKGKIFHFDLYRMKNIDEVYDIGMEEYLDNAFLCIIEWPEIYEEELADFPHHEMKIENLGDERVIIFK
ncbi:MAG TPA: tRNA (adenosine(37)-N6)-threonylcarbamoyltransferase complex ATPase subunit type 1 TsaE [Kaistella sp.]|jgi:tRNA threonylcarbamoyladenosine biosynthesis protein TsaE|uniref:tRNA (adenosine(37)-N6)-threonylcarbamoyltransferase complex ATPase subunit type 1 TsaE n=1 Tax=Candidatus Kaistella beijingensis TaxID=2820270 RepID=UPI0019E87768|nr:tRNA (adenosine(37)-N6)-threonylcarbamoyltransferase complex ATPase subunit type 1 TsaE [Candidatus Kaistella beijingensis]MBE2272978.1 tRNA (adenosine(37)-N6)-threonylcarbamoyltransferase complex ATPase subunit type 1 TsaE [Flavobacteriales bacterium]HMU06889.1 tRNA (adenosine(37)-N6)-threonylcarbamoyltransferase complex ATPase subunit type 1 TsaE [Kaistella sp.]UBB90344.1 tRNA (adenosine(37)-N6)-threonylcarbamoyltransferase complex ATPase subunit type 1 TsaE [Candidatus Kaistella beijingens